MTSRIVPYSGLVGLLAATLCSCAQDPDATVDGKNAGASEQSVTVASNMKLAVGHVDAVTNAWTPVTLTANYSSMVVVATPAYSASSPPLITRIRNVTANSFELKVDRFDTSSAAFSSVGVDYIVTEAGKYTAANDGITLEAARYISTVTDRKGNFNGQLRSYLNAYASPVVLGQVMTYADARPSVFWSRGSSSSSAPSAKVLRVGKHVGEDPVTARANETVGYIVIESGSGMLGNVAWQATLGPETVQGVVSGKAASYTLTTPGHATRAVLSQSGMNGGNGSWPLLSGASATTGTSLLLNVDEDQMKDKERSHSAEQVAYLAINQCPNAAAKGQPCESHGACTADGACCPDADADGVCDAEDACSGSDDRVDTDHDGKPDACDPCPLDSPDDIDGDNVCNSVDRCPGADDRIDTDGDGTPDGCDRCPQDALDDSDGDGTCDSYDLCPAGDDHADYDGDGRPDACDPPDYRQCVPGVKGQGVIDGNVVLTNANALPDNLTGTVCITGDLDLLSFGGSSLAALERLSAVGGRIHVTGASALTSFADLVSLRKVGNGLVLDNDTVLDNLDGLQNVNELGGSVSLTNLPSLRQIDAISRLSEVHGDLTLVNLPNLFNLYALSQVTSIQGKLTLQSIPVTWISLMSLSNVGEIAIADMPNLYSLDSLLGLTAVTGSVTLNRLVVSNLIGLRNLTLIGGDLVLDSLGNLGRLDGLESLARVGNTIRLENNWHLQSIAALQNLTQVQQFTARNNGELPQCDIDEFLENLHLTCSACSGNNDLAPCTGGSCFNGSLWLSTPADLQALSGTPCINGDVTIAPNGLLTDLTGLEALRMVSGNLTISSTNLTSLHGLENLRSVSGRIQIEENTVLTSVNALGMLTNAGDFRVIHNMALSEASVPALQTASAWYMGGNPMLAPCWALLVEQQLGKGCLNCAYSNGSSGACPAPVDGWIDQTPNYGPGYVITFASGGAAGSFTSVADAHATYPTLNLAEPVYDGYVTMVDGSRYGLNWYNGGGACCWPTPSEVLQAYPYLLILPWQ